MSYNLRYASLTGENSWLLRRPLVRKIIEKNSPDIIGTQEGLYFQLRQMEEDLADYAWIGLGREGGSQGEFMAVFYRKDRLEPVEYDHYWLSDRPAEIGSATWGNKVRRMVTWVKFRDRRARQEFVLINTHFDHEVEQSRQKSAQLVAERMTQFRPNIPVIMTGDFNTAAGDSTSYKILTDQGGLRDAWAVAAKRGPRTRSFNGFAFPVPTDGARIDWILVRGPIGVDQITIDDWSQNKQYPSDHFPVVATLRFTP
ncbi:endonuclease/exonuclease/phosphatase family protein [bacterium]|nr:endonuclease/exonuclease/phosphatase family protein [bacterium]